LGRRATKNIYVYICVCVYLCVCVCACASLAIENSCFLELIFIDQSVMRSSYYYVPVFEPHSNSVFHTIPPHFNFNALSTCIYLSCSVLLYLCNFILLRVYLASQQFISAYFVFEGSHIFDIILAVLFQIHHFLQLQT
jgi:hypothetical protein